MADTVFIYRRHVRRCRYAAQGRAQQHRCACPVWVDGRREGRRVHHSLKTTDWPAGQEKLRQMERGEVVIEKALREAFGEWMRGLAVRDSTLEKYGNAVGWFVGYLETCGVRVLRGIRVEHLDGWLLERAKPRQVRRRFRAGGIERVVDVPGLARGTLARELQAIRLWMRYAQRRQWLTWNPAEHVRVRQARGRQVQPFAPGEVQAMVAACGGLGRGAYERLRARALILLLRYTGLRIGDAVKLERARVRGAELMVYTEKAGTAVWLPIPDVLVQALEMLPVPKGVAGPGVGIPSPRWYFWNGVSKDKTVKNDFDRTLRRVWRLAGVAGAHAHRFRHTLAVDLLAGGATLEEVARVLGNTPGVVAKHYAPWCAALQSRVRELVAEVYARDSALLHGGYAADDGEAKQWKQ